MGAAQELFSERSGIKSACYKHPTETTSGWLDWRSKQSPLRTLNTQAYPQETGQNGERLWAPRVGRKTPGSLLPPVDRNCWVKGSRDMLI